MSQQTELDLVGVVCGPEDAKRAAMEAYLARRGLGKAKWFTPGDLHGLDREVLHGRIRRVVFAGLPDLLESIWDEEIDFMAWPKDLHLEFADPPGDGAVRMIVESWQAWRRRHRRRQAIAGVALSAIVLGVSFVLCVLLARWGR